MTIKKFKDRTKTIKTVTEAKLFRKSFIGLKMYEGNSYQASLELFEQKVIDLHKESSPEQRKENGIFKL